MLLLNYQELDGEKKTKHSVNRTRNSANKTKDSLNGANYLVNKARIQHTIQRIQ